MAERILMNEYKALSKEPWVNIELKEDVVLQWNVALIVTNPESLYYGGYFKAAMQFPSNYPYSPPSFKFFRPIFHPNIYPDGNLCISILHAPGEDETSGEAANERWSPAQRVESVLLSIISLLDDAEVSSPANVDAGVMFRKDPAGYKARVKQDIEASKQDIPEGFVMPKSHETCIQRPVLRDDDQAFWFNSEDDEDFGASDSDNEMSFDQDYDDEDDDDDEEEDEDEDEDEDPEPKAS